VTLTEEDRFRGAIIETLMCRRAVDLDAICAEHGRSAAELAPEREALAGMQADGLVEVSGDRVALTPVGQPWLRSVARVFDLRSGAQSRFSRVL
jgi:oxygen-independent coproporphyrinogen-3 oxidase